MSYHYPILHLKSFSVIYKLPSSIFKKKYFTAVDNIDLSIFDQQCICIVGESGCGKSSLAKGIFNLEKITKNSKIFFKGKNISFDKKDQKQDLLNDCQIIFQDSTNALNPRMTIEKIISEPLYASKKFLNNKFNKQKNRIKIIDLIAQVGLPKDSIDRYPHEFSGGQRKRISIARALITKPRLLIADEPFAGLDNSIKAQLINLIIDIKNKFNLTLIVISHDLATIRYFADQIVVMYLGRIVEQGDSNRIFRFPYHPYTKALINSILPLHPNNKKQIEIIKGDITDHNYINHGCRFYSRCKWKEKICKEKTPLLESLDIDIDKTNYNFIDHKIACHVKPLK